MKLIALFHSHDLLISELPHTVFWEDGRNATIQDYFDHIEDTHEYRESSPGRFVMEINPDIEGEILWDDSKQDWCVSGDGIETFYLELDDQNVVEEQIIAQLHTFPIFYKCKILRQVPSGGSVGITPTASTLTGERGGAG